VISLLVKQAARNPQREIYRVFDRKGRELAMTVEELLRWTRRIAFVLDKKGVVPGDRVLLILPTTHHQVRPSEATRRAGHGQSGA
jgi:acyl-CoA synthetase (AMP-forming)/AMP-acid ligase II